MSKALGKHTGWRYDLGAIKSGHQEKVEMQSKKEHVTRIEC